MGVCADINREAITPAMRLLPARMDSLPARRLMLAIGMQESRLIHRRQIGGPARGLWQFERGGGVVGVLRHHSSKTHSEAVCEALGVPAEPMPVYHALEHDDVLAAAFARLLLFTDPRPLPQFCSAGWDYYIRTWRPGKPHAHTWADCWSAAVEAVG